MRRTRMLLGIVGLLGLLGLAGCDLSAAAKTGGPNRATGARGANNVANAQAQRSGVWVEVSPSSTTAGFKVAVRADCLDNSNPATVTSPAFGSLTLQPHNSSLVAEVVIPPTTKEGRYTVTVSCRTGATATTSLSIIGGGATVGPHTGGGFLANTDDGGNGSSGASAWLLGGAGALALAGAVGAISVRRRRPVGR